MTQMQTQKVSELLSQQYTRTKVEESSAGGIVYLKGPLGESIAVLPDGSTKSVLLG